MNPAILRPSDTLAAPPTLMDRLESCRLALARHLELQDEPETWAKFLQTRRDAASAIARLASSGGDSQEAQAIIALQCMIAASGAYDAQPSAEDLAIVEQVASKGPLGLVAAMLLVSPEQWPAVPLPLQVPGVYWNVYTAWLFYTPRALGTATRAAG